MNLRAMREPKICLYCNPCQCILLVERTNEIFSCFSSVLLNCMFSIQPVHICFILPQCHFFHKHFIYTFNVLAKLLDIIAYHCI
uniref:Uncharacterized protein n=1 Tax=Anguilla anguilla TaxID=7936 RepID=A0A0E9WQR9_ANGAN